MQIVKHQLTLDFVKRGLTVTDVQKLDQDRVDIPLGQLLEEADLTESSMGGTYNRLTQYEQEFKDANIGSDAN